MRKILVLVLGATMVMGLPVAEAMAAHCREFTRTIRVGGKLQEGVGTACLQEDGSWRMQSGEVIEQEIAWNEPRERVIYVDRERPVYYSTPYPLFSFSFHRDFDDYRPHCGRRGGGWKHGGHRHGHGHHGHGRGHGRGRW